MPTNYGSSALGGYESIPQSIVQKALLHNFNLEEKARREEALLNLDFYYGKQEQSVFLMNLDVEPFTVNLTKPVVHKRASMLYSRPLVRHFQGPDQSVKFLEQVYKDNRIDSFLLQVDLLSELTGSALVHPYKDKTLPGGLKLRLYDGTQFTATGNDENPATADAISLIRVIDRLVKNPSAGMKGINNQTERVLQQQIWMKDEVSWYEGDIPTKTEKNPLGFLPFVNFRGEEVHDQYVGYPPAQNIRKLNKHINQMLTELAYVLRMQAGTPIVLSGFQSGETVAIHPGRAINVPAGGGATTLNLQPKIREHLDSMLYLEDRLYTSSSVPRISVIGGQEGSMGRVASGRELVVRWFPLLQVFQEKTVRFNQYEIDMANMILAVAGMEPVDDINIEWPEESLLPLSAEEDTLDQDIKFSIKTPIDEIVRRNPSLTEEEAAKIFEANVAINEAIASSQADIQINEQVSHQQDAMEQAVNTLQNEDISKENFNDGRS